MVWGAIGAYIVWGWRLADEQRSRIKLTGSDIYIMDSATIEIIERSDVQQWIVASHHNPVGVLYDSLDLRSLRDSLASHNFVRTVSTQVDFSRRLRVEITQRRPVMRVASESGARFYITDDGYIEPIVSGAAQRVPVVTGSVPLPFPNDFRGEIEKFIEDNEKKSDKNYLFLTKLINFVNYIACDELWNSQIVQINLTDGVQGAESEPFKEPRVELIPRVGNHIVELGTIDGYESKLPKLLHFYRNAGGDDGWTDAQVINIEYNNEVIIRRSKK